MVGVAFLDEECREYLTYHFQVIDGDKLFVWRGQIKFWAISKLWRISPAWLLLWCDKSVKMKIINKAYVRSSNTRLFYFWERKMEADHDWLMVVWPWFFFDWSITRSDWPAVVAACDATKKDVNGRDGVFRINAANYFDKELCIRAFGKSPQQIINCLKGHVEEVSELGEGVLIILSYTPLSTSEITTAGERLREILVGWFRRSSDQWSRKTESDPDAFEWLARGADFWWSGTTDGGSWRFRFV